METQRTIREMKKSRTDRMIAGVCGGLGAHTALPSWLWRVLILASLCLGGFGVIIYLLLWVFMPAADRP